MWKRFLRWLKFPPPQPGDLRLDGRLAEYVHRLAEQERRSPAAVAADLLNSGLERRGLAHPNLQYWRYLSPREQEVAALVCLGYNNRQIAERLVINPETVRSHLRNILRRLNLRSRSELRLLLRDWDVGERDA